MQDYGSWLDIGTRYVTWKLTEQIYKECLLYTVSDLNVAHFFMFQHQPLCDSDVNDNLPDAAQCAHTYSHFKKAQAVEENKDALPLNNSELFMCFKCHITLVILFF